MWVTLSTVLLSATLVLARPDLQNPFQSAQKWIDKINNDPNSTWEAGINFDLNTPASYVKTLACVRKSNPPVVLPIKEKNTAVLNKDIPKEFDSRKRWPFCKALKTIRDQGNCGSCWAVATTSAFTDRVCIKTKGKFNSQLAAIQLVSCSDECSSGCDGGFPGCAWRFFKSHGVVTGGDYGSKQGCQPYPLKPCEHFISGKKPSCSSLGPKKAPACQSHCTNKSYKKPIKKDIYKGISAYNVRGEVTEIQKEIMTNGPASATIDLYEDFLHYKKGVYKNDPSSKFLGLHSVKLIGWGVENSQPYWLLQNSWNADWGDKGLFKVLRGSNVVEIEDGVIAGVPQDKPSSMS